MKIPKEVTIFLLLAGSLVAAMDLARVAGPAAAGPEVAMTAASR